MQRIRCIFFGYDQLISPKQYILKYSIIQIFNRIKRVLFHDVRHHELPQQVAEQFLV